MGGGGLEALVQDYWPITFDAGGLIAVERGDARLQALLLRLARQRVPIFLPTAVLAEVWRGGRGRQARLASFLNAGLDRGGIRIVGLDLKIAKEIGLLLARATMSLADAAVCHCALAQRSYVLTSDPVDIGRLIPRDRIVVV